MQEGRKCQGSRVEAGKLGTLRKKRNLKHGSRSGKTHRSKWNLKTEESEGRWKGKASHPETRGKGERRERFVSKETRLEFLIKNSASPNRKMRKR